MGQSNNPNPPDSSSNIVNLSHLVPKGFKKLPMDELQKTFTNTTKTDVATFIAEMTPIIGDAMAAKEVYNEIQKDDPNWLLVGALGGATIIGAFPLVGDAASQLIRRGARQALDVAKRIEVNPNALGSMGGNISLKPKVNQDVLDAEALLDDPNKLRLWQDNARLPESKRQANPEKSKQAAKDLFQGNITSKKSRSIIKDELPNTLFTKETMPNMPTVTEVVGSLGNKSGKNGILGVKGFDLEAGQVVSSRLDIPAYNNYNKWVVSIHDGTKDAGSVVGYGQAIRLKNIRFGSKAKDALDIAKGKRANLTTGEEKPMGKATIARIFGEYIPEDPYKLQALASKLLDDPDWVQVGMNPYKGSAFYDKATGFPVVEAEEVIQVGPLVLARGVKKPTISQLKELAVRTKDGKIRMFNEGGSVEKQTHMAFVDGGVVTPMDKDGTKKLVGKPTGKKTKADRMVYKTSDGEFVSEKSTTFEYGGKWINVPTIHNGYEYDQDELNIMLEHNVIKPTSIHDNIKEAEEAAKERSFSLMDMAKGGAVTMDNQMELFAEGGFNDQGGTVDEVSGNEVPVGSLKEEVRDDIPANVSEGEFVLPADVVRYFGLAKLMKMRDEAKSGLAKMEDMGQMGNSDEVTVDKNMPFSMEDLDVEDEEGNSMEFADGGYVRKFQVGGYSSSNTGIITQPSTQEFTAQEPTNFTSNYTPKVAPASGFEPSFGTQPQQQVLPSFSQVIPDAMKYMDTSKNIATTVAPTLPVAPSVAAPFVAAPNQNNDREPPAVVKKDLEKIVNWDDMNYDKLAKVAKSMNSTVTRIAGGVAQATPLGGVFTAIQLRDRKKLNRALQNEFLNPTNTDTRKQQLEDIWQKNVTGISKFRNTKKPTLQETVDSNRLKFKNSGKTLTYQKSASELAEEKWNIVLNNDLSGIKNRKDIASNSAKKRANERINDLLTRGDQSYRNSIIRTLNSGYSGSTVNGIAVGAIADIKGQGGVVAHSKGTKDIDGKDIGGLVVRSNENKTVFKNSEGEYYTNGGWFNGGATVVTLTDGKWVEPKDNVPPKNTDKGKPSDKKSAVCTAFRNLGYLPDDIWALDDIFGRKLEKTNPTMVKGYRLWAVPVAKFIQTNTLLARTLRAIMWPITKAWANEMAYRVKPEKYRPNLSGKAIMLLGGSVCALIGYVHKMSSKQNGELV